MKLLIQSFFIILAINSISCKKSDENKKLNEVNNSRYSQILKYKESIDSLNANLNWTETNFGLWRSKNGDLALKTTEGTEEGLIITKYITNLADGKSIKNTIDTATFKYSGNSFYQDKNHIYTHYAMADGGNFWIVENAHVKSFTVIGDCYAKDRKHIFTERNMKTDTLFDYQSFKTCKNCGCFAKDKNGFYFWDEKIDVTHIDDPETKEQIRKLKEL